MLLVARLKGSGRVTVPTSGRWRVALTTEDGAFAPGSERRPRITTGPPSFAIEFAGPCAVVLTRSEGER